MGILEDIAKDMEARIAKEQTNIDKELSPEELYEAIHNPKPLTKQEMLDSEKAFRKEIAEIELSPEYKEKQEQLRIVKELAKDPDEVLSEKRKGNMIQATVRLPDGSLQTVLRKKKTWKGKDTTGTKYLYRGKWWYENEIYKELGLNEQEMDKIQKFKFKEKQGLEALIWYFHKRETKSHVGKLTVGQMQSSLYNWLHNEYY